jgi:mannose-6-phosphate isomerase-like protein (cupin superfamily)
MTTPTTAGPVVPGFSLNRRTVLHLATDQSLSALSVDDGFWAHGETSAELRDGRIMSVFAYESTWTSWERHPDGTEFLFVLSGAAVIRMRDGSGERSAELSAGECALIPEGVWHRAEITMPTRMLFVTPSPALTELRDAAAGVLAKVRHG